MFQERERQILYDITYMWNLNYGTMNLSAKQKRIHKRREQTCGCQEGMGRSEMDWEFGVNRLKLLHFLFFFVVVISPIQFFSYCTA